MQYVTLFTPVHQGPPSQEHIAKMGALIGEMFANGSLVATGGLMKRGEHAIAVTRKDEAYTIAEGQAAAKDWMAASGFALINAATKAELIAITKRFLDCAGDGTSEILPMMSGSPPKTE